MELEDGTENARRDERNRVDDHLWLFRIAHELISNTKQAAITAIAQKRAENRHFAKDTVHAISRHECACDRHIALLVIERALKYRSDRRTTNDTFRQIEIALALFNQGKAALHIHPRHVNITFDSLGEAGAAA